MRRISAILSVFAAVFAAMSAVSCSKLEFSEPLDIKVMNIYGECKGGVFYHSLEALSRAVKWQKINAIDDDALKAYFMNLVFLEYDTDTLDADVLRIGNLLYSTGGSDILEQGSVWTVKTVFDYGYDYRIECLGNDEWRVTMSSQNLNSVFSAPSVVSGDFVIAASDSPSYDGMEFVFTSGSGKIEDEAADSEGKRGVLSVYIEEPVSAVIDENGYDYYENCVREIGSENSNYAPRLPVTVFGGAMTITGDVEGDEGFTDVLYYVDLSLASMNENIVRIYFNGVWKSYVW